MIVKEAIDHNLFCFLITIPQVEKSGNMHILTIHSLNFHYLNLQF